MIRFLMGTAAAAATFVIAGDKLHEIADSIRDRAGVTPLTLPARAIRGALIAGVPAAVGIFVARR